MLYSTQNTRWRVVGSVVALIAALGSALGSNDPVLTLTSGSVIALTIGLLWQPGAEALLIAAGSQLSQVIALLFYANVLGVPLQEVSKHFGDVTPATWFGLAAISALVIGMWCGQLGTKPRAMAALHEEAEAWSPNTAFAFCLVTLVLGSVFSIIGRVSAGLAQPALAASRVEWLGVFVLVCVCIVQRRGFVYLLIVITLEIVKGFTGYFADFKDVFFVLLVGILSARPKMTARGLLAGIVTASVALTLGAFWSEVKGGYRLYISEGSRKEIVVIPIEDRLVYLMDRAFEFDGEKLLHGFALMAKRWGYVDLLSATLHHVPEHVPFQDGALIGATVLHVLQPRVLFPDKPSIANDTDNAVRYTGVRFDRGHNAANTSISLGYVAEFYVDFGFIGALGATFALGFLFGRSVKAIGSSASLPKMVNSGLAVVLMMSAVSFEEVFLKIMGSFLMTLIMILLLRRFLLPYLLQVFGPTMPARFGGMQPQVL